MSDNDLIKRGDVLKEAVYLNVDTNEMVVFVQDIKKIPAVPQEMTAREYLEARERLCAERLANYGCNGCPMLQRKGDDCETIESNHPEEAVAIIEKWAKEHPEERSEG